jgi:hypothetical protein
MVRERLLELRHLGTTAQPVAGEDLADCGQFQLTERRLKDIDQQILL